MLFFNDLGNLRFNYFDFQFNSNSMCVYLFEFNSKICFSTRKIKTMFKSFKTLFCKQNFRWANEKIRSRYSLSGSIMQYDCYCIKWNRQILQTQHHKIGSKTVPYPKLPYDFLPYALLSFKSIYLVSIYPTAISSLLNYPTLNFIFCHVLG